LKLWSTIYNVSKWNTRIKHHIHNCIHTNNFKLTHTQNQISFTLYSNMMRIFLNGSPNTHHKFTKLKSILLVREKCTSNRHNIFINVCDKNWKYSSESTNISSMRMLNFFKNAKKTKVQSMNLRTRTDFCSLSLANLGELFYALSSYLNFNVENLSNGSGNSGFSFVILLHFCNVIRLHCHEKRTFDFRSHLATYNLETSVPRKSIKKFTKVRLWTQKNVGLSP